MCLHVDFQGRSLYHGSPLEQDELQIVDAQLQRASVTHQVRVIEVGQNPDSLPAGWDEQKLEKLREKIHQDFDGTALREEVFPDPPVRGLYGYAFIPLQENAIPVREKPFQMYGERKEALEKITQEWIDRKFIERPTKGSAEWLSQAFAVPNKSATMARRRRYERSQQVYEEVQLPSTLY